MRCNLVMLCHWHLCQCHIMLMASSMVPFNYLCQNDWNEVQHTFWSCAAISLTEAADDADGIVNGNIAFVRAQWLKWGATGLFWSYHNIGTDVGHQHCQRNHYIPSIKTNKKWEAICFWSCDTIAIAITWCHWHHGQCYMMLTVS